MKCLNQFKTKLLLFLVSGILFLSLGFIIISCGTGPMLKAADTNKGAFAIDFSLSSNTDAYILASSSNFPSIANKEFTVEAWVMPKSSSVKAPIFTHADSYRGILVYLYNNVLKAKIGYGNSSGTSSTVSSGYTLSNTNTWYHTAVVLTNQNHSGIHTACAGAESQTPHIDIYVDGAFKGCGDTIKDESPDGVTHYAYDPTEVSGDGYIYKNGAFIGYMGSLIPMQVLEGSLVSFSEKFNAAIDDVRFWLTARTATEINQCKGDLLGLISPCNIDNTILKGYWPLNEGTGTSAADISGNGINGIVNSPADKPWSGGWTTGKF
ncbi:MAG: LamG-like jellyroll fold domain-containing protein [Thermodesulfovibrionia bacterium]|nr:LamG-like jellyroll fold domain-containing protein [Thermodesulfovibrionia bacterium]